jgi:hypothetical protein
VFRHEISGLVSIVGPRLAKLHLMLEGRGQAANDETVNNSQVRTLPTFIFGANFCNVLQKSFF